MATATSSFPSDDRQGLDPTLFEEFFLDDACHITEDWNGDPDQLREGGLHLDGDDGLIPVWSFYVGQHIVGTVFWCTEEGRFYDNSLADAQDGILNGPDTADEMTATFRQFVPKFCTRLVPVAVLRDMLLATDPKGSVDEHIFLTA